MPQSFFLFNNVNRQQPKAESPATPVATPKERAGTSRKRQENPGKRPSNSREGLHNQSMYVQVLQAVRALWN